MKCTCNDWKENMPLLNNPFTLNLSAVGKYTGKQFSFCPWCGKILPPNNTVEDRQAKKFGKVGLCSITKEICNDERCDKYTPAT